jgi:hypothetical protein
VTNDGPVALTKLVIALTHDPRLDPAQATAGHIREGGDVVWEIPSLEPGKTLQRQLQCRALEPGVNLRNRVRVTAAEGLSKQAEAMVTIERPASELTLSIADLADPVTVGGELQYLIRVTNAGRSADTQAALIVVLPAGAPRDAIKVIAPPTRHQVEELDPIVRFFPLPEIKPGESVRYRVNVRADRAGTVKVKAVLSSQGLGQQQIQADVETTVLER